MRRAFLAALLILPLGGCALPPALSIASFVMDAGSYVASGKSMTDHGISMVANQDCALFNIFSEGRICRDTPYYETAVAALEPLPGTAPATASAVAAAGATAIAAQPFLSDGLPRRAEALRPGLPSAATFLADGDLRPGAAPQG